MGGGDLTVPLYQPPRSSEELAGIFSVTWLKDLNDLRGVKTMLGEIPPDNIYLNGLGSLTKHEEYKIAVKGKE